MFKGIYKLYRWPVLTLFIIFWIGVVSGLLIPSAMKIFILQAVADKFAGIINASPTNWHLSLNIFTNNLTVSAILYLCGFFVILPAGVVFSNGLLMGVFFSLIYRSDTLQPGQFISALVSLIPHGIFELSAFFLVGALSIIVTLKMIFPKYIEAKKSRKRVLWESLTRFVAVIIPLLVAAAMIETFISPRIAGFVQNWWLQDTVNTELAVTLNQMALAEHGCTASTTDQLADNVSGSTLDVADGFTFLSNILYDETLYQQLVQRKAAPFWETILYCSDNQSMIIQSRPKDLWSQTQATNLTRGLLTAGELEYTE